MPALEKVHLIFNPSSGHGFYLPLFTQLFLGIEKSFLPQLSSPGHLLQEILQHLGKHRIHPDYTIANSSRIAESAARRCAQEKYDLVIAVGGDGTLNAVANGLAGTETAMAIIPAGTVNLFAMQVAIPRHLAEACSVIAQGRIKTIDLGLIKDKHFLCVAGIGFDAFVIKHMEWQLKMALGAAAYLVAAGFGFFTYPFRSIYARVDQQAQVKKGYMIFVGNAKYYGGKMVLLPKADLNDGLLDVCILKKRNFLGFLRYLAGLRRGRLEEYLDVDYFQCREIDIMNHSQYIQIDGEYFGRLAAKIKIAPNALKIIVPPS